MKIAIVNGYDDGMKDLAAVTVPNKRRYADRHGYTLIEENVKDFPRHPYWIRLKIGMERLNEFDGVWLNDIDSVITNMDIRLEQFFVANFVCTIDRIGFNVGQMFLRNDPWTHTFLADVWNNYEFFIAERWGEQTALAYRLYREPKDMWAVLPQRSCNSYIHAYYEQPYEAGEYQSGDFCLHLPAVSNDERIRRFNEIITA